MSKFCINTQDRAAIFQKYLHISHEMQKAEWRTDFFLVMHSLQWLMGKRNLVSLTTALSQESTSLEANNILLFYVNVHASDCTQTFPSALNHVVYSCGPYWNAEYREISIIRGRSIITSR